MKRLFTTRLPSLPSWKHGLPSWKHGASHGLPSASHGLAWHGLVLTLAFMALVAQMASAADWFVATNGTGYGTSWADATNSLQGAINAISGAYPTNTVWVSNGVYQTGGITNFPTGTLLTNRVAIWKAITVRSADNNPTNTIIKGAWDPATNGPAAVRCVYMTNGSTLIGFTLTNGATLASSVNAERGGGVSSQSTNTVISNCVIAGNSAGIYGGGAIYGTLFNCTLTGNSAVSVGQGGGAYGATLFNCTLTGNSATNGGGARVGTLTDCTLSGNSAKYGGGAEGSTLFNCMIVSNSVGSAGQGGGANNCTVSNCTLTGNSGSYGGGAYYGTLFNCTLTGNSAGQVGGGAQAAALYNCLIASNTAGGSGGNGTYNATLFNCTLIGNSGGFGGGARLGTLNNCTIVGNLAPAGRSGGTHEATLYNCITWGNSPTDSVGTWYYSCAVGLTNGGSVSGNITNDPLFITNGSGYGSGHVAGNYRLCNVSPPLNAGTNMLWMTNSWGRIDLDGLRRIDRFSGVVDMGCYELMPAGTMFTIFGQ